LFGRNHGLGSRNVRCLYEDSKGWLWVGSANGLSCQIEPGRFVTLTSENGLEDPFISQILEDEFGHLWLGSNRGIFRLQREQLEGFLAGELNQLGSVVFGRSEGL
jgi:ligand-binding sensor domain-containing protein